MAVKVQQMPNVSARSTSLILGFADSYFNYNKFKLSHAAESARNSQDISRWYEKNISIQVLL